MPAAAATLSPLAARLSGCLERHAPGWPAARVVVAFSGGTDSTALAAAVAELIGAGQPLIARAIHVDHGLQAHSGDWALRCAATAQGLGLRCDVLRVEVDASTGESLEAQARVARYGALARSLAPGDCLLSAHHADDQLETVLLQLMRGAGVAGLAAMPEAAPLGAGLLLRPWLGCERGELAQYVGARSLAVIDDPMNDDPRFDRVYLRMRVVPLLKARWPAVARTATRSAALLGEALGAVEAVRRADLVAVRSADAQGLDVARLLALPLARRREVVRQWLREGSLPVPNQGRLDELLHQVAAAGADRHPRVEWPGAIAWRERGVLRVRVPDPEPPPVVTASTPP